ncbi:TIR domain-containing protein [Streptomyces sp. NPDC002730]|uniref:TIR domain-containing protein n=1 Tax=Streptomyces sp. NPDC002730 TaxID=3364662 RepID=UPI0036C8B6AE
MNVGTWALAVLMVITGGYAVTRHAIAAVTALEKDVIAAINSLRNIKDAARGTAGTEPTGRPPAAGPTVGQVAAQELNTAPPADPPEERPPATGARDVSLRAEVPAQASAAASKPLAGIQHEPPSASTVEDDHAWDVFISYASEDKEAVARPLAEALRSRGVEVWLDELVLRIGDSLRRKIDYGLARSTFGVVVLSKPFFAKGWAQYELDGIVTQSVAGSQRLLPIWHEISKEEVARKSPSLVDKIARDTSTHSIEEIAEEIAALIDSIGTG